MMRFSLRSVSFLGAFAAAAASLATSAPPPDWARDDATTGETTLAPEQETTVIRLRASSRAVASSLSLAVTLDPTPVRATSLGETPIVLFVGAPTEPGTDAGPGGSADPNARMHAVPGFAAGAANFDSAASTSVPIDSQDRIFEVRVAWTSPNPEDLTAGKTTTSPSGERVFTDVERPLAPRRPTKIQWRATIHAEGYDDAPAGATVDVEPAP